MSSITSNTHATVTRETVIKGLELQSTHLRIAIREATDIASNLKSLQDRITKEFSSLQAPITPSAKMLNSARCLHLSKYSAIVDSMDSSKLASISALSKNLTNEFIDIITNAAKTQLARSIQPSAFSEDLIESATKFTKECNSLVDILNGITKDSFEVNQEQFKALIDGSLIELEGSTDKSVDRKEGFIALATKALQDQETYLTYLKEVQDNSN